MLRTNPVFLRFFDELFQNTVKREAIFLKKFPEGSRLLRQGSLASEIFVIRSGITKCYLTEENGKDFIVEFLGEGEILGEIEVIRNRECLCNIATVTEVEAYVLSLSYFKSLLAENLSFNQLLLGEMAERVANTSSRSSAQQLYSLEHSLKRILTFQSTQNISLSKEDMAAYLGITVRSLNRALREIG